MSRETSANASASISTIHIFRHVTDQFCYFPPLLPFFYTTYVLVQWKQKEYEQEKEGERERQKGEERQE